MDREALPSVLLCVVGLVGIGSMLDASQAQEPQFRPTLQVQRANGLIHIDGDLDDEGWKGAAVAEGFVEVDPGDQVPPPVDSRALVTFDDANLYVAFLAADDPDAVRVSLRDRDEIWRDDYFGIMLDTYGDLQWGYEILVNPLGIQGDLRVRSTGEEDMNFDLVWHSEGKVTDQGYQVEVAIPFSSLRFERKDMHTWRVNFWRDHQREVRRRYAWAAQDRDDPCFMCQWGYLTGVSGIEPSSNVDLIASAVGFQSGALADGSDPDSDFDNEDPDGELSLNVRYGITPNASAEATINPDFSQVESDAAQVDVNQTFALFFPERRPFFQEGSDLYDTWLSAIYTRSINEPSLAGKFTGQLGRTSFLYLVGRDDRSPLFLPLEERSVFVGLEKSTSNIARVRRSFGADSFAGLLVTDRRVDDGGAGSVISADTNIRFLKNFTFEAQAAFSNTEEPADSTLLSSRQQDLDEDGELDTFDEGKHTVALDGEDFSGHAEYVSLERGGRVWNSNLDYYGYSPTFRTDNGFTTRNDYHQASVWNGLHFRPNRSLLLSWEPSVDVGRVWNYEGRFKDEWIRPNLYFELPYQSELNLEYLFSGERFGIEGHTFDGIRIGRIAASTQFGERVFASASTRFGRGIYRDFDSPELAEQFELSLSGWIKPHQQIRIEPSWNFAKMDSRITDENLFEGYILRTRLTYNFTREWFMRLVLQYDDFDERFDVEPLVTYRINPFTVFFLGASSRHHSYDLIGTETIESDWKEAERQIFAKLQYLFRV